MQPENLSYGTNLKRRWFQTVDRQFSERISHYLQKSHRIINSNKWSIIQPSQSPLNNVFCGKTLFPSWSHWFLHRSSLAIPLLGAHSRSRHLQMHPRTVQDCGTQLMKPWQSVAGITFLTAKQPEPPRELSVWIFVQLAYHTQSLRPNKLPLSNMFASTWQTDGQWYFCFPSQCN